MTAAGLALVTGASGAIGHHVVRNLAARGWRVLGLGHGAEQERLPLVGWINGEIDAANLSSLARRHGMPQAVIHLAGGSSVGPSLTAPLEDFSRTVAASVRLFEWVRQEAPSARVVLASSAAVYGNARELPISEAAPRAPLSPYGYHKAMMEQSAECWGRNFGLNAAIVRLFSVYGPDLHKQLVWELCLRLSRGERHIVLGGTGGEMRDWLHIDDAAAMLVDALDSASPQVPVFNGCTGVGTTVAEIAHFIAEGFGAEVAFAFNGEVRPGDPVHLVGCPDAAARARLAATVPVAGGMVATARKARATLSWRRGDGG